MNYSPYFYAHMVMQGDSIRRDYLRIEVNPDATLNIVDFTLPSFGPKLCKNVPQSDVPTWILTAISVLRIADEGVHVAEIGLKVSDNSYYVYDRQGESNE